MKSSLAALLLFLSSLSTSSVLPQSLSHPFTSTTTVSSSTSYGDMIRTPVVVSKVEDTSPGRPLAVSLPSPHTTTNTVVPLTVTGGSAPYTYTTSAGSLARVSIGSPEVFLRAPTKPGKVIVTITDKTGDTRQVSIQVSTRLSIPSSVVTLTPSTTYVIKPLGGSSPYTYRVLSGDAKVSKGGVVTSSTREGRTKIAVRDLLEQEVYLDILTIKGTLASPSPTPSPTPITVITPTPFPYTPISHTTSSPSPTPINAYCGDSNGKTFSSSPTGELCNAGEVSTVSGIGPYTWACRGRDGGASVSCSASKVLPVEPTPTPTPKVPSVNGTCGLSNGGTFTAIPSTNLCTTGNTSSVTGIGPYAWSCSGIGTGTTASCSASKTLPPTNGVCGQAAGTPIPIAPTTNLCSVGTPSLVTKKGIAGFDIFLSSSWSWSCSGSNGGTVSSCTAPVSIVPTPTPVPLPTPTPTPTPAINGTCGTSHTQSFTQAPSLGFCATGQATSLTGSGPWSWGCTGVNGGTSVSCGASLTQATPTGGLWSDTSTWGGTIPKAGESVTIPQGKTVVLNIDTPSLGDITINGTLTVDPNKDINLTASAVYINQGGTFTIGTPTTPYQKKAIITLTGAKPTSPSGFSRGIMNMGGTLGLYATAPSPVWTKLNDHAEAGTKSLTLKESTNWKAGDLIAIAPTDWYSRGQTERLTLTGATTDTLTTSAPLVTFRWGKMQYPTNTGMSLTPDPTYTPPALPAPLSLDERAEVANLSRNIVIQGADDTAWNVDGYGANIMTMSPLSAKTQVDGIEIRRGGQAGVTGRYPIHWHMLSYAKDTGSFLGDTTANYLKNSSIWNSMNRCVTIHGTNGVQILNNICEDIKGHAFFMEDAVERRNVFEGNLAMMMRVPEASKLLQLHEGNDNQTDGGPSGYWITNPDNTFRNNTAVDAFGLGFWLAYPNKPLGLSSLVPILPNRLPHGVFDYNTAHSNRTRGIMLKFPPIDATGNTDGSILYSPTVDGSPDTGNSQSYGNRVPFTLKGNVLYKNTTGGYENGTTLPVYREWTSSDNFGTYFSGSVSEGTLERSLLIGTSLNSPTGYFSPNRYAIDVPPSGSASYHSALAIKDNVGINFPFVEQGNRNLNGITYNTGFFKADDYYFRPVELGTIRNSNNKFINTSPGYRTLPPNLDGQPLNNRNWTYAGAVWDANGYWGPKGNYWVYDYPFFTSGGNCTPVVPVGKNGQSCEGPYYGVKDFTTDFNPDGLRFYNSMLAIRQDSDGAEIGRWVVGDGVLNATKANFRHFAARKDGRFTLSFPDDPLPKQIALNVENAYRSTDTFILGLRFDGSVTPMGYTFGGNQSYRLFPKDHWPAADIANNAPYTQSMRYFKHANSMAELVATTTDVMWQDKTNNMLWIRYKGGIASESPIAHLKDSGDFELLRSYSVVVYPKP